MVGQAILRAVGLLAGLLLVAGIAFASVDGRAGAGSRQKPAAARSHGPVVIWQVNGVEQAAWLALDRVAVVNGGDAQALTVKRLDAPPSSRQALGARLRRLQSDLGDHQSAGSPSAGAAGGSGATPSADAAIVGAVLYQGDRRPENRLVTVGDIAVCFRTGATAADKAVLADQLGLRLLRKLSVGTNSYLYRVAAPLQVFSALATLSSERVVEWAQPSFLRTSAKRATPDDPLFSSQWHLRNVGQHGAKPGEDANVAPVWDETAEGLPLRGVHGDGFGDDDQVIAIADDGLEIAHPDLAANVIPGRSYDWADGDVDPSPSRASVDQEMHGTACAGVAAARGYNGVGVVGSAPWAGLVGYRFLIDGVDSDITEAEALAAVRPDPLNRGIVDISSNSWGPEDDRHLEAPGPLTQAALVDGVTNGRGGKGIVYVWAAGNGRAQGDNVNYDGYANSRYAMAVGASTALGKVAPYSEDGAPLRVVSPSSDGDASGLRDITTVDMSGDAGYVTGDYSSAFGGTSASAPAVSGVVALLLQANPQLTWRDVQAILMTTAAKIDPSHGDWKTTAAGYHVNHTYGFGRVNAAAAVAAARTWRTLGPETTVELSATPGAMIPDASSTGVTSSIVVGQEQQRLSLEYVEVVIDAPHAYWHDLEITLVAPSGTESILSVPATPTDVTGGANLEGWRFGSARHFGESSLGTWRLRVRDLQRGDVGRLDSWTLRLYGAVASPDAKPPVTSVVPARHWWNGTVKVELRAVDRGSNVARTDLRVAPKANGPFKALAKYELRVAKRTHASDGRRTLWFRSIDNLGNTERVRRFVLNVDTRPPTTAMLGSVVVRRGRVAVLHARARDPGFSAHRVRLRLQVVGANGRVVRLLDAGIRRTGDAVKVRFRCDLPKGRYTVRALARDLAGNAQNVVGSSTLTVI